MIMFMQLEHCKMFETASVGSHATLTLAFIFSLKAREIASEYYLGFCQFCNYYCHCSQTEFYAYNT